MKEILCNSAYFGVTVSLIGYGAGIMLKKKFKYAFLNPLLISIIFVIGVVMLCGVDYESYENSAQYLSYLLTPATVCLAVPLYQQMTFKEKSGSRCLRHPRRCAGKSWKRPASGIFVRT